jgi:primase-polymerase (primpol)-like protein
VTPALRLTVLDLDDCVTPDGLTPGAWAVVAEVAETYVEFSPSGQGLHVGVALVLS